MFALLLLTLALLMLAALGLSETARPVRGLDSLDVPPPTVTPFAAGELLVAATPGPLAADTSRRLITGRIVPFGEPGETNFGRFTFAAGAIALPVDVSEIKLLVEHDQAASVGYALAVEEKGDGLWATFHVPEGDPDGDLALTRAANKVRNAFSVGVALDEDTHELARRAARTGKPVAAKGRLKETSLVAVPAFTSARVTDVAASAAPTLVLATWSDGNPGGTNMHTCQHCHAALTPGVAHTCPPGTLQAAAPTTAPVQFGPVPAPAPVAGAVSPELLAAAMAMLGVGTPPADGGPAVVPAVAGAAAPTAQATAVVAEPPTYTFDGQGHGFIRDAWAARTDGDAEAAARIARFGAELTAGGAVVEHIARAADPELMTAAVETRVTAPEVVQAEVYRGDQLIRAVDRGRPMFRRMRNVRLTDATPFKVPIEGEFDGVGPHTEGTAHVAEGTLELGNTIVEPGAISGAYRFSRELADSSNPAIDGIAIRAMIRDYRRGSEAMVAAALALLADGVTARPFAAEQVDTPAELRAQIIAHALANDEIPADFAFAGASAFTDMATEVATDGRPYFPYLSPTNAAGSSNIRQLALNVDGMEYAATSGVDTDETFLVNGDDVLVGESPLLTFRFEQPEGPGIIKVALWAYQVAHVMRDAGVRRLSQADEA